MTKPILFSEYSRQDVHDIFSPDTRFTPNSGTWGLHGIVEIPERKGDFVFFVTYGQQQAGHAFDEWITEAGVFSWQSQPRQSFQDRRIQQFIHHDSAENSIYLFLRTRRNDNYTYLGKLIYLAHDPERENPVYMYWQLSDWPILDDILGRMNLELQPEEFYHRAISSRYEPEFEVEAFETFFTWRAKRWQVDRQAIISQVRDWINRGLPEEALRFRDWYIDIDGRRISPKWLFHLITGADYNEFDAPQARDKLSKIGFNANRLREPNKLYFTRKIDRNRSGFVGKVDSAHIRILENKYNDIRRVLAGAVTTPADEVLCDWVLFCYEFELYNEGQLLFTLITSELVNPWYYERTKKIARLCAMKATAED